MASYPDNRTVLAALLATAKAAGAMITSARPSTSNMLDTKKNSADLVTETDQAVEAFVSSTLKKQFPACLFVGEESYSPSTPLTDAPTFIVDPIDGTTNFVHSFPQVCISLGFAVNKRPQVGVVYNPFLGLLYYGVKGEGSFLVTALPAAAVSGVGANANANANVNASSDSTNLPSGSTNPPSAPSVPSGSAQPSSHLSAAPTEVTRRLPLRAPESLELSKSLIAAEWGSERSGNNWLVKSQMFASLCAAQDEPVQGARGGGMAHGIRSMGSAALNMCGVAAGELDAYWEGGCWAWDVCAGWVILEEAGGHVVGANPGEWQVGLEDRRYLCVRGDRDNQWRGYVESVWGCVRGRLEY